MRGSQGAELATSTLLSLEKSYFSGEAPLGYHQDTHLGARGALSTLRVVSWSEKAVDKARQFMGKPACTTGPLFSVVRPGRVCSQRNKSVGETRFCRGGGICVQPAFACNALFSIRNARKTDEMTRTLNVRHVLTEPDEKSLKAFASVLRRAGGEIPFNSAQRRRAASRIDAREERARHGAHCR